MKKSAINLLLTITILSLASCEEPSSENFEANYYSVSPFVVNGKIVDPLYTEVNLIMYTEKDINTHYEQFEKTIKDVHKQCDRDNNYYDRTNIKTLNDAYSKDFVEVSPILKDILVTGIEMTNLTEGYFNIGIGSLIDAWGDKFDSFGLPGEDIDPIIIQEALQNVPSIQEVNEMLTFDSNKIKFNKIEGKDAVISLGGIAKGYAIDYASSYLNEDNSNALVSAGSSSIATINKNPLRNNWNIAIRLPNIDFGMDIAFTISLKGSNYLSCSADNEKNFIKQNEDGSTTIRHHILNPYTGYSENYHRQIFLYSNNASGAVLDALSTALMNVEKIAKIQSIIKSVENYYNSNIEFCVFDDSSIDGMYDLYATQNLKDSIVSKQSDKINLFEVV